jgi:hypothetical protein
MSRSAGEVYFLFSSRIKTRVEHGFFALFDFLWGGRGMFIAAVSRILRRFDLAENV